MSTEQSTSFSGKIAIVTGGSRGLGQNTVLHLAKRGVHSILTYVSNLEEADKAVAEVNKAGAKAIALKLDIGDIDSIELFLKQLSEALGEFGAERFDFLVNNAGVSHHASFEKTTATDLDQLYNVNFKGTFLLTQKLLPYINDGGRIVMISTGLTRIIVPESAPYASLKGAIEVLTKYLAKELGPRRITVNAVAPGAIQTDFSGGVVRDNPAVNKMVSDATALGRPGLPDDIGAMIASLLTEDNRWVNAQRIEVSGGQSI